MGKEPLSFQLCKDFWFENDQELAPFGQRNHCPGEKEGGAGCGLYLWPESLPASVLAALVCCTKANFFPGNWCSEKYVRSPKDKGRTEMILRAVWLAEQWSSTTFL